jgi:hypothetical protein
VLADHRPDEVATLIRPGLRAVPTISPEGSSQIARRDSAKETAKISRQANTSFDRELIDSTNLLIISPV